ncbi:hypothetical protein AGLY_010212 [Aphis glycines]|uniref:Uncharacterized protein n=1 Tax=Aphis glycines TaxID=307491 RepID=A0A6G0THL2_APHGL|nr:hypothetical protein AGLY_010212 [Aphis glycines]
MAGKWIPLCCTLGIVCESLLYIIEVLYLNPMIMVGKKGGLCFNGLNTPKFKVFYNYCNLNLWEIFNFYKKFYELYLQASNIKNFNDTSKKKILRKIENSTQKKSKYFENQIIIYNLYFLNNNKYLKSFENKSLVKRYLVKIENSSALKIFPITIRPVFFIENLWKTECCFSILKQLIRKLVLNFKVFLAIQNFFSSTLKKKILKKIQNFRGLLIAQKKKSKYFENLAIY